MPDSHAGGFAVVDSLLRRGPEERGGGGGGRERERERRKEGGREAERSSKTSTLRNLVQTTVGLVLERTEPKICLYLTVQM